jgi:hypothetical protein
VTGSEEGTGEVDLERLGPIRERKFVRRAADLDSGIRKHRRWSAEALETPSQDALDRVLAANVRGEGQDFLRACLRCVGSYPLKPSGIDIHGRDGRP